MATSTSVVRHRGKPFGQSGVAVTLDPSLFGTIHVAARNAGIKQLAGRRRNAGDANPDDDGTGPDTKPPTDFFAGHYPERN